MSASVFGQGIISTIAGGLDAIENGPAAEARLDLLFGLALDPQGNVYVTEARRIRKVNTTTGLISTVFTADAVPFAAYDPAGKLLIYVRGEFQKLDLASGTVTKLATFSNLDLNSFFVEPSGNVLVTDYSQGKIYRMNGTTGAFTTIAGIGPVSHQDPPLGDGGPATAAVLGRPTVITEDVVGNIFFAEQYWLRRIDGKTGLITTLARQGNGSAASGDGGTYDKAVFGNITGLATDAPGNLYIADGRSVRKIDWNTGIISTVAGTGKQEKYAGDGVPAVQANLGFLYGIAVDAQRNLWIADNGNDRLLVVSAATGLIRTVAGTSENGDGGPAALAQLPGAVGLAATPQGDLYLMASGIRRIDHTTGKITVLGDPQISFGIGGNSPVAVDSAGNVFISETARVRRLDAVSGNVTTVAGDGSGQYGDVPLRDGDLATKGPVTPAGVVVDQAGNLFIADRWNNRIRRVDALTGIITTVAGNGKKLVYAGETGRATEIAIGEPTSIAQGANGDLYWSTGAWILRMNTAGTLSVAAGEGGGCVYAGDGGSALAAPLCYVSAIAVDPVGNIFATEEYCGCVRRIDAQTGIIQTVAGTGQNVARSGAPSKNNDGLPATQAVLSPGAIAVAGGNLYILDDLLVTSGILGSNRKIRVVTPAVAPKLPQPPSVTSVVDAVSYQDGSSPGGVVAVYGNYLAPQDPLVGQAGPDGRITSTLASDQITFNGVLAPLLYISPGQVNTVVPYSTKAGNAVVQMSTVGGASASSTLAVSATALRLFSNLVFNSDGTLNSATHPATPGSVLIMYGTGIGLTNPAYADGTIVHVTGAPYPGPAAKFTATVGSGKAYSASILYLGPIPEFVAGAVQANIQVPFDVPAGQATLTIGPGVSSYPTGASVTIFITR